jgi:transcription elongation factor SPT6
LCFQAIEYLKTRPVGDFVFRPSTQGSNHLTITWKFNDDSIVHIDVLENNKSTVDSLGQQLVIGNQRFDDLDHIAEAHIGAMNRLLVDWNAHPRFAFGDSKDVSDLLRDKKEQQANVTPYALWTDKTPSLRISFLENANRTPKSELVQLTPAGYVYRKQTYRSVNLLINAFKADCAKQMAPVAPKPAAPIIPPVQTGYQAQPAYVQPPAFGYNAYAQQPAPMQYFQPQQPPVYVYGQPAPPPYPMPQLMQQPMQQPMPFGVPAPPAPGMHPDRIAQISDDRRGYNCAFAH